MKRLISLLLTLLMVLSLVACGSQTTSEDDSTTDRQTEAITQEMKTQAVEETTPQEDITEPIETETPVESREETLAFDTSWAGGDYVIPIPAPPFKHFKVSTNHYPDCLQYYISSEEKDEIQTLTENDIRQYCALLKDSGFTKIKTELDYNDDNCIFVATTEDETVQVYVDCYMGIDSIVIFVKQNIVQE